MEDLHKSLTVAQIWAGIATAALFIIGMVKHFKSLHEAWPSLKKLYNYFHKGWFSNAIFKKDVMEALKELRAGQAIIDERLKRVEYEVKDNSGGSLKDATKRIEEKVYVFANALAFTDLKLEAGYQLGERMSAVFNRNAECIDVNPVFLKTFGKTKDEVMQVGYEDMIHEEDVREFRNLFARAIEKASSFARHDLRMFDSEGAEYHVYMKGHTHKDRLTGQVENYFVTFEIIKQ